MTDRTVLTRLKLDISDFNRNALAAAAGAKAFTKTLDTSTDRMQNLVQTSLALGPALVPIGAAAVPAISGLTNQLAFAAVGAGVAALAFSGVGDALKAVNDYAIDPTEANLQKMHETMASLGPAGRDFVRYLQEIRPELQGLQDLAQEGMLPGAEEGIRELMQLMPQVESIITTVSTAVGDLMTEAGDNLNDARWVEFFEFLDREARPTLIDMGRTVGNFAEGFANLWMAFDPLSDDFSSSFLQMSRDFAAWSDGLAETEGFQEFVDYIRDVGPQAWDTLGALGNALVELVVAAAPVGAAVLPVIEVLADTLATIADSDVGPVLIGAAAGISAISRAVALYNVANGSALAGLLGKSVIGGAGRAARDLPAASRAYLDFGAALDSTGPKVGKFASTSQRLGAALGGVGKVAAGAAGVGIAMSDLGDSFALSNTAAYALMGTMAGPWGTAIGAGVGAVKDLQAANEGLAGAVQSANQAIASGNVEELAASLAGLKSELASIDKDGGNFGQKIIDRSEDLNKGLSFAFGGAGGEVVDKFTTSTSEAAGMVDQVAAAYAEASAAAQEVRFEEAGMADAMRGTSDATRAQVDAILSLIDAHNKLADEKLAAMNAEIAFEQALDDASAAARSGKDGLDINTAAGRDNMQMLNRLAGAWNSLTPAQQSAEGAAERARNAFIRSAMGMGASRDEARKLANALLDIPTSVTPRVDVKTDRALANIRAVLRAMAGIRNKRVTIVTDYKITGNRPPAQGAGGGGGTTRDADGSIHYGGRRYTAFAGGGFNENHIAQIGGPGHTRVWNEPETGGEAYIPLAWSKRERSLNIWAETGRRLGVEGFAEGALLAASRVQRFADPGYVSAVALQPTRSDAPRLHVIEAAIDEGFIRVIAEEVVDGYDSHQGQVGRMTRTGG